MKDIRFEDETDLSLIPENNKTNLQDFYLNNNSKKNENSFLAYISSNYQLISILTNYIEWFQFISVILFLSSAFSCFIRSLVVFSPFVIFGLLILSLLLFSISINLLLKIKCILDEFQNEKANSSNSSGSSSILFVDNQNLKEIINNEKKDSNSISPRSVERQDDSDTSSTSDFGSIFTVLCFNLIALNMLVFLVLLCIKIDKSENLKISIVIIPILVSIGTAFLFYIYLFPVLFQKKLYLEILTIGTCLLCIGISAILFNSFSLVSSNWTKMGSPMIIALLVISLYILFSFSSYSSYIAYSCQLIGFLSLSTCTFLILLKLDGKIEVNFVVLTLALFFGFCLVFGIRLHNFIQNSKICK